MYEFLKIGDEVTFPGLLDLTMIVEEVLDNGRRVRCKYFDEHLKRFIKLTLPSSDLIRCQKAARAANPIQKVSVHK